MIIAVAVIAIIVSIGILILAVIGGMTVLDALRSRNTDESSANTQDKN